MPDVNLNLWQRLKIASRFIRNKSINDELETKKTPYTSLINLSGTPQYSLVDYQSFYTEGYEENSLIYSAITYKAKNVTQAKLTAYQYTDQKGNFQKLEWGNDLQRLLDNPNPYQSGDAFHSLQNVYFNLTGNAFTFVQRNKGMVVSLWPLNPAWITIIPDSKGEILGYEYRPVYNAGEPVKILRQDMAHWKLPNPNDPLAGLGFGMSPVLALARSGDIDNMINRFLNVFFKNGSMPAGILKFKDISLDEDEMARIRERWKEIYGGYGNWSDVGILDQYGEYQRIGLTIQELDFEKLDKRNETRIFASLGVPIELLPTVSSLQGSTYNNKSEARKMFWQDTMIYELEVVEQELARFFNDTETNIFIKWDLSEVAALKGEIEKQVASAFQLYQMKVPPRIAFETVGLVVTEYDGIDDIQETPQFGGFGDTGDSSTDNPNPDTDTANQDENAKNQPLFDESGLFSKQFDLESKKKVYEQFDKMIVSHEPRFLEASKRAFEKDRREILSIIYSMKTKALENKANIIWNNAIEPADEYLFSTSKTNWRNEFTPLIEGIYGDTENFWGTQLGIQFNIRNLEGELALDQYTLVFSDFVAQTNSDNIKSILQTGYKEGYTIDQMTNSINDLYDGWSDWRGELISRTETTRAANDGARKLYKRWGIAQKEWLATADDRTRDTHLAMNEQIRDIDKPFDSPSGAQLMQPGDSSAPLSETAACRCTVLPVVDNKEKIGDNVEDSAKEQSFLDFNDVKNEKELEKFTKNWENIFKKEDKDITNAFYEYSGSAYSDINKYLRGLKPDIEYYESDWIYNMDRDFKNELGENLILRRGVYDYDFILNEYGIDDLKKLKGAILKDNGYMSTSTGKGFRGVVNFDILAESNTKGAYIESITAHKSEFEFVLPSGTRLEILDVIEEKIGVQEYRVIARILQ